MWFFGLFVDIFRTAFHIPNILFNKRLIGTLLLDSGDPISEDAPNVKPSLNTDSANAHWKTLLEDVQHDPSILPGGSRVISEKSTLIASSDVKLVARLGEFEQKSGFKASSVYQAAWAITVAQHQSREDIVFAVRPRDSIFPQRIRLPKEANIFTVLNELQKAELLGGKHSHIGFEEIIQQSPSHSLRIQSILTFDSNKSSSESDFPISLSLVNGEKINVTAHYDRAYSEAKVKVVVEHFLQAIRAVLECDASTTIADVDLIGASERAFILEKGTAVLPPHEELIHHLFEQQVERTPHKVAVEDETGNVLSFEELNSAANRLARSIPCGSGTVVPICTDRSISLIIGVLAVLKTGATYVVLDPDYPLERLRFIVEDVQAPFVLTVSKYVQYFQNPLLALENLLQEDGSVDNLAIKMSSHDPAYIIYTSGSTGRPKGVILEHRAVTSGLMHQPHPENMRALMFYNPVFAAAQRTIFATLTRGGCLCLASKESLTRGLSQTILKMNINTIGLTSSTAALLSSDAAKSLKRITLTGEKITQAVVDAWGDKVDLQGGYALSECTQMNWSAKLKPGCSPSKIGRPYDTTSSYVLIPGTTRLAPILVPGEICLSGPQVARSYLNRPEQTSKAFIQNPFGDGKMYRTGDMAVCLEDGSIEIIGRIDMQVKIAGQRLEPVEVTAVLREHTAVETAAVVAVKLRGETSLVACIVPFKSAGPWSRELQESLKTHTLGVLPSFAVPSFWYILDALPTNSNGKADIPSLRTQLEKLGREGLLQLSAQAFRAERKLDNLTEVEKVIRQIWANTLELNIDVIDLSNSFLELGGSSIRAIEAATGCRDAGWDVSVSDIIRATSLKELAASVRELAEGNLESYKPFSMLDASDITPFSGYDDVYPVSPLQEALVAATLSGNPDYLYQKVYSIKGVDYNRLKTAFESVFTRNDILRTTFLPHGSSFVQAVQKQDFLQWESCSEGLDEYLAYDAKRSITVGEPFIRIAILPKQSLLVVTTHHSLFDYWSHAFVLDDAAAVYEGRSPRSRTPYSAFIRHLVTIDSNTSKQFWQKYLEGISPCRVSNGIVSPRHVIQKEVHLNADGFLSANSLTSGSLIYAAWGLVLANQTISNEVVFATTLSGRDVPVDNVHTMGGPTLTTVPQRIRVDRDTTVLEYVRSVQDGFWDMNRHSHVGIRGALHASGHAASLFDTMVNLLAPQDDSVETEKVFQPYGPTPVWNTEFTTLEAVVKGDLVRFQLNSELDANRAAFIVDQFMAALTFFVSHPEAKLSEAQLIGKAELDFLASLSSPISTNLLANELMHSAFERTAAELSDNTAIHWGDNKTELISYKDLNSRANRLAALLREKGVGPENVIPLCLEKSVSAIVSILGILKAGGAYAPLDHENPPERNNFIANEVEAKFIITERIHAEVFAESKAEILCVDELDFSGSWPDLPATVTPDNLAYILYTSGSTGLPKGVCVPHSAIAAAMSSIIDFEGCHVSSRILQFSNFVFDVSISDIFTALNIGATLCLAPMSSLMSDLAGCINSMRADHVFLTPTVAKLLGGPDDVPGVKKLILGGEALPPDLLSVWAPKVTLMNGYGPTEASVFVVMASVPAGGNNRIIGRPIKTVSAVVLQADSLKLTPYGAMGELCVSGPQLARGYLKRPDITEKTFVDYRSERLYRTGDLVRWLPDGQLECFGRKDSQVKISGHRIELGEIEQAVLVTGKVVDCVVKVVEIQEKKQLVAFVVFEDSKDSSQDIILPPGSHADSFVSISIGLSTLPPYMVPKIWVPISHFPLMPSGKANSKKLVQLVSEMDPLEVSKYSTGAGEESGEFVEVETNEEKMLQDFWSSVLGIGKEAIGANSSFFSFGGDSISAISLVSRVRRAGFTLAVGDVLAFPVLGDMAGRLKLAQETTEQDQIIVVSHVGDDVYNQLLLRGVGREDIETILPCGPGQAEFRKLADREEQFWQLQTVRAIPPDLDMHRWLELTTQLTEYNSILRTMYIQDTPDHYLQVVLKKPTVDFATIHVQNQTEMDRVIEQDWKTTFSLGQPFIRYRLLVLPDGNRSLLIKADHGSYDGTLLQIFDAQFKAIARGKPIEEPASFHSFVSHIQRLDKSVPLQFWRDLLKESDFSYPSTNGTPNITAMSVLKLDRRIDAFASQCGVTVPIVLQTAYTILLARMGGTTDVSYDNLVTGRDVDMPLDTQLINGCCANFIPFRSSFHSRTTVRELLRDTQALFWKTTENGTVTLSDIYSDLDLDRDQNANKCLFLFQPFEPASGPVDHMRWIAMGLSKVRQPMNYALMLEVFKSAVGYSPRLRYDPRVFSTANVEELGENLISIIEGMMAHSRAPVQELLFV